MPIRSFLAFDIHGTVRANLAKILSDFAKKEKHVRWVSPEQMHVTLKFFGNVEEYLLMGDIADKIEATVKGAGAIQLKCLGLGVFPNWKYPKVFWAGFTGMTEQMIELQGKIETSLDKFELSRDKRKFRLHLTIGRAKAPLKKSPVITIAEKLGPVDFGNMKVEKLVLYKSVLTKQGAIYTPLREFVL